MDRLSRSYAISKFANDSSNNSSRIRSTAFYQYTKEIHWINQSHWSMDDDDGGNCSNILSYTTGINRKLDVILK